MFAEAIDKLIVFFTWSILSVDGVSSLALLCALDLSLLHLYNFLKLYGISSILQLCREYFHLVLTDIFRAGWHKGFRNIVCDICIFFHIGHLSNYFLTRNPQVKDLGTCLLSKGNLWVFPLFLIAHTNCVYFFDPVTHSNMNKPQVLILCRVNRVKIILLVGFKYSLVSLICILVIQLNSNRLRKYGTVLTKSFSIQGPELFKLFFF